jgi:catechol 2,3-dioxygenase-like lactoylglutathione lyase family enzyme
LLYLVNLSVSDIERSGAFYDSVLAPLGWRRQENGESGIAWGLQRPVFYITKEESQRPGFGHVSFAAKSIPAVRAAHESGVANGGESEAEPGSSPLLGGATYAARLYDPDGYLVEFVAAPG